MCMLIMHVHLCLWSWRYQCSCGMCYSKCETFAIITSLSVWLRSVIKQQQLREAEQYRLAELGGRAGELRRLTQSWSHTRHVVYYCWNYNNTHSPLCDSTHSLAHSLAQFHCSLFQSVVIAHVEVFRLSSQTEISTFMHCCKQFSVFFCTPFAYITVHH